MGMFKKPKAKKFEPSKEQKKIERQQLEEKREQESEVEERKALKKIRTRGRGSLLTGAEGGLKETVG